MQEVLRSHHIIVRVRSEDHNRSGARFEQDEEHPARASRWGFSYEQLFAQVKDTPLCDLYANETEPGFSGHCPKDPNALIGDTCGWCSDNNEIPTFVEEHLGVALIDGVWGWLIGPEGLLVDAGFLSRDKNVPEIPSEGRYADHTAVARYCRSFSGSLGSEGWVSAPFSVFAHFAASGRSAEVSGTNTRARTF